MRSIKIISINWKIAKQTNYEKIIEYTADIRPMLQPLGAPTDELPFVLKRPSCKCICFLKCFPWLLHHRDGLNHQEGDVIKYFDWNDINATGKIVLDIVKDLVVE